MGVHEMKKNIEVGDLVKFVYGRLGASISGYGLVADIEEPGADYGNVKIVTRRYKILHENRTYWIPATFIEEV
jgi:hypothetical protein